MHQCWAQRRVQSSKVMRQMVFNQKIKGKVGYLNGYWDFQRKTFASESCMSNLFRCFHQDLIVYSFAQLGFGLNLADMFRFFICSQHPLSAYCWARQEPGESRSKLLDAGVYRSGRFCSLRSLKAGTRTLVFYNTSNRTYWAARTLCENKTCSVCELLLSCQILLYRSGEW